MLNVALRLPGTADYRQLAVSNDGTWQPSEWGGEPDLGRGWWALPGLADSHSHLAADSLSLEPGKPEEIRLRAYACLKGGTFLVVDKGWRDSSVVASLADRPPDRAPDFEAAGRMIAVEGGYYPGFATETDAEGLSEVVREAVSVGDGWVKLVGDWPRKGRGAVANFDPEALGVAVDVAHAAGARVSIHTMAPEVPSWAVAAGVDSIEHGLFLTGADLEALAARGGAWVPTVLRMEAIAEMLGPESSGGRLIRQGLENVAGLLADVPDGVSVLAGTDLAVAPSEVGREVVALRQLGLDPVRAVEAASVAAYRYLGRPEGFEIGHPADAVFFDADPHEEPDTLTDPVAVIRHGERVR